MKLPLFITYILVIFIAYVAAGDKNKKPKNKYSEEANLPTIEKYDPDIREIQQPYRMAKLNMIWAKARNRLTEPKLKSLYSELKIQDKEELAWKQLNSQHKDKDGIKEGELRKKLLRIMNNYGLTEHFEDTLNPEKYKDTLGYDGKDTHINKSMFKDKKLNRLWEKAELAGFTTEEMTALKEEFEHHQDKIDVYYNLLENLSDDSKANVHENAVDEEEHDRYNEISYAEKNSESNEIRQSKHDHFTVKANQLRDKHRDIRDNFDRLERITGKGPNSKDFIEPKVQGLWRVALASDFTSDELSSLKTELLHYESRLMKLRQLHTEHAIANEKHKNKHGDKKHDRLTELEENIKKQSRKVEKIQEDVERRVFKHSEL